MNFSPSKIIDRTISAISPKWGMEREAWRQAQASYKGGVPTRRSESWGTADTTRFNSISERQQMMNARDRAYNAYQNNPVARTLVQTEVDNVIGDGLNYQPTSDSEEWNKEAKDRYYEWLEQCTVRGPDILSGCEFQRMAWEQSRIAGDVGWLLVNDGAESRLQMWPSETIVTPDGSYGDPSIYDGIKFDAVGRPLIYYLLADDGLGKRKFEPIAARDFVFLSHLTKPSQTRGLTCYATIFDLLANLDRYVDGVGLAAWMATVFGLIYKDPNAGKQLQNLPFSTNSGGNQQRAVRFENGMMKYMAPEGEIVQVDAKQPMQQTPDFIRAMFRMLGQPFDMPLEVIAKDMSVCTFASARIGLLPFYRSCRIKAARFGSRWSRTIKWWLSREHYRAMDDPKRWKSKWPANYWKHDLLVNEWQYTDPISEPQSDLLQIDMGVKSAQMVISERGRDAEQILRDRQAWAEKTSAYDPVHSTYTRDSQLDVAESQAAATPAGPDPKLERIKGRADAYGVAVRAGAVTPQKEDEQGFRSELELPPMGDGVEKAWEKDEGARRPITLTQPGGAPNAPSGNQAATSNSADGNQGN